MFDEDLLSNFKARLLAEREALQDLAETGREAAKKVTLDQACVGRLSRMDALQGQAMALELERRRGLTLRRIASALQRIQSGEYGYCLRCEEPIAKPRLELDPAQTMCIDCANDAED